MKLLIVIVNYRVTDLSIDCLETLVDEVASVPGTHVGLCENGTGSEDAKRLEKVIAERGWGDWVTLTTVMPNRGFTGGNNVVIEPALTSDDPPEYIMLLNADTLVRSGAIKTVVDFLDAHPEVGIAGCRQEDPDGTQHHTAFRFFSPIQQFERGMRLGILSKLLSRWELSPKPPKEPAPTDWVSGASMVLRREVLEKIGVLNEELYTYFDDIDLCLRAKWAGWETWYIPEARIVHLVGRSTGVTVQKRRSAYWFEARRHFFLTRYGAWKTFWIDAAWITGLTLFRVRRFIQRKPDPDPQFFWWDSLRHSVFLTGFKPQPVKNPALSD